MKTCLTLLFGFFFSVSLFSQNQPPVISNLAVNHSPGTQSVTFSFDVSDNENDPLDLQLRISADSGRTWLVPLDSMVGDTGFPITPGNGKSITWVYDPASLAGQYPAGMTAFEGRVIADDRQPVDIQALVDQVDSVRVFDRLEKLEGVRNNIVDPTRMDSIRDSLETWMAVAGLQDWHHSWAQFTTNDRNISGRIAGLTKEARTWISTGHYDTVNGPGTDDNGTAVVGVLEAAAILGPLNFRQSLRFVNFDLEEQGLIGSFYYVQNEIPAWEDLQGVINLEMIGYKDDSPNSQSLPFGFDILFPAAYNAVAADSFKGNFLTNVANTNSSALKTAFDNAAAQYVPDLRVISLEVSGTGTIAPDLRRSDHARFWDFGYPALMLTDGADLRNPNYHTSMDVISTLDRSFLLQNIKANVGALAELAEPMHADVERGTPFVLTVPVGIAPPERTLVLYPNPSAGAVGIRFAGLPAEVLGVGIFDIQGKLIREMAVEGPTGFLNWDGRDGKGQMVPSGSYFVRLKGGGAEMVRRVEIVR